MHPTREIPCARECKQRRPEMWIERQCLVRRTQSELLALLEMRRQRQLRKLDTQNGRWAASLDCPAYQTRAPDAFCLPVAHAGSSLLPLQLRRTELIFGIAERGAW